MMSKGKYTFGPITDSDIIVNVQLNGDKTTEMLVVEEFEARLEPRKKGFLPDPRIMIPQIQEMEVFEDDVFICAYIKCGTHWIWEMCQMLVSGKAEFFQKAKACCMLESHLADEFSELPRPRVFNTHMTPRCLPRQAFEKKCKIIIIERNPKDIVTSYFHHMKVFLPAADVTWSQCLQSVFDNNRPVNSNWFFHKKKWSEFISSSNQPVLTLKYEDVKMNTVKCLAKIGEFLQCSHDEDLLKEINDKCTVQNMREMEKTRDSGTSHTTSQQMSALYRKGVVGDWKHHFTVAQSEQFDDIIQKQMNGIDVNYKYEI